MPKLSSPRKKPSTSVHCSNDFTLADFADAAKAKSGRMKKGDSLPLPQPIQTETLSWDEKDLDEFDIDISEIAKNEQEFPAEDVTLDNGSGDAQTTRFPAVCKGPGIVYPVDVWILISGFIEPEDVWRFAGICQASHLVVHTAQFWMKLYKRWYTNTAQLPYLLTPAYMEKVHGLRTRVIKSLFYLYTPFSTRLKRQLAFENEPESLRGQRCVLMWHKRYKNQCHFFFKFRRAGSSTCSLAPNLTGQGRLARFTADIVHNPEEDNVVLQVMSAHYLSLPSVMGMLLHNSSLSVGHGMRSHKLRLVFTSAPVHSSQAGLAAGTTVTMDPVICARILHWWEPSYPQPT